MRIVYFFLTCFSFCFASISYQASIIGVPSGQMKKALQREARFFPVFGSLTVPSRNALRFLVENDIPRLKQVVQAYGYYDAEISYQINERDQRFHVLVFVHLGPQYTLKSFQFFTEKCTHKQKIPECPKITLKSLGIQLNKPALAGQIEQAQEVLLIQLANCGFPLASIHQKKVLANALTKTLEVQLCVQLGPKCRFGPLEVSGLKSVDLDFVLRKIQWKEGEIFSSNLLQETQKKLISSDLFNSVLIIPNEKNVDKDQHLPIKIQFNESKHHSIALGASYATLDGPGATISWSNRNLFHKAQQLQADITASRVLSIGSISHTVLDFLHPEQKLISQIEWLRQDITTYLTQTYKAVSRVERDFTQKIFASLGAKVERLSVNRSIANGEFLLVGIPGFLRYSSVDNILNPRKGFIASYKATLYQLTSDSKDAFYKNTLWLSTYLPLEKKKRLTLALRTQLGALWGSTLDHIPFPKRFLAGAEDNIRGYRFKTLSPLNRNQDPEGGLGYLFFTPEIRLQFFSSWGLVFFSDLGRVTRVRYPDPLGKWFKSVGIGARYFTFFSPLRLDVAFPLDRRRFDPRYRIYISIGQTF